ncbi:MAG: hypothetical protein AAGB34_00015 [Planctomycetota bacterium]
MTISQESEWVPQPAAQSLVNGLVARFLERSPHSRELADRMINETATRLIDFVDHIEIGFGEECVDKLGGVGFVREGAASFGEVWVHHGGLFPKIIVRSGELTRVIRVGIRVDQVEDFLGAQRVAFYDAGVLGAVHAPVRFASVFVDTDGEGAELRAVERHGDRGFDITELPELWEATVERHLELFRTRPRGGMADQAAFEEVLTRIDNAAADLGRGYACDLFFRAEREYWMSRNAAGRSQYARQQKLGLGWANAGNHTFRSSREWFQSAIRVLEALGMECRERFYVGEQAGWGVQVLECAATGIVVFCDVDVSPEEVVEDFAHAGLARNESVSGTNGLWCGLHGESMLGAGIHHLQAQFDWHQLVEQLKAENGIEMMEPFSTFPYLRQALTEGERWSIDAGRVDALAEQGVITAEQAEDFKQNGAIGSHLENLERNDGFKGFNEEGVSDIVRKTGPRKAG